ncbi:MAG TPA: carboxymuconolactone decarboxylase family protein [Candidatus Limnocylindria bacterium]|nr:carboxymuconolactone decarboxylase family protein [Candidatus Limnocylindria bacterium]
MMTRIPPIDPKTATGRAKELLDGVHRALGMTPNLLRTMAQAPAVLDAHLTLGRVLGSGTLSPKTREAIALATAGANGCAYCASAHAAISQRMQVPREEIDAHLAAHSSDPKLAALLGFALAVVTRRGRVSDAELAAARAGGATDGELLEVVANVAANTLTNYVNHVAGTEIDFPPVDPSPHRAG